MHAAVIAASDPIVNWFHEGNQLTQSVKYMQKYSGNATTGEFCLLAVLYFRITWDHLSCRICHQQKSRTNRTNTLFVVWVRVN